MKGVRSLVRKLVARLKPGQRKSVDFYAATWIDEIWVRSSALAARRARFAIRMVISGDRTTWPEELAARYAEADIPLEWAPTVEVLHSLGMRVVVTASSGIPRSYFGESLARLIHMPHSLASLHAIYPADAFDGCDTLFAAGPHHTREFQALGAANGLGPRACFAAGYGKFDVMRTAAPAKSIEQGRHVLVAPSWGENNLLSRHGLALTETLVEAGWRVTLRPHPSFFVYPDGQLDSILVRFADHPSVAVERSTGGSCALWQADVMISDYSGMALEYAALRSRPVVFVDGPRKILNPHWEAVGVPAVEIDMRERLGLIADSAPEAVLAALDDVGNNRPSMSEVIADFLHDEPHVGEKVVALLGTVIAETQR